MSKPGFGVWRSGRGAIGGSVSVHTYLFVTARVGATEVFLFFGPYY